MIRVFAIACSAAWLAVGAAPAASADDVPGMSYGAVLGASCNASDRFVYGRGSDGETLVCAPGGTWAPSPPLVGVRLIATPCVGDPGVAQAPDGIPLVCVGGQGWQPAP